MYLERVTIRNYASLEDISFEGKPILVFIGPNGAGKSLILESLHKFFSEFSSIRGGSSPDDLIWHRRVRRLPVEYEVILRMTDNEMKQLIHSDDRFLKIAKENMKDSYDRLMIKRTLLLDGSWTTDEVKWADSTLIQDDVVTVPSELIKSLQPQIGDFLRKTFENYKMYFFTEGHSKDSVGGARLVVNLKDKKGFVNLDIFDELVRADLVSYSTDTKGKDMAEWAKEAGYEIAKTSSSELDKILRMVSVFDVRAIPEALNSLREKFILLPAARDVRAEPGSRKSLLDTQILSEMSHTSVADDRVTEIRWEKYRRLIEGFLNKRLDPNPTQIRIKEGDLGLPTSHIGGGEQSILGLVWDTTKTSAMMAIEEPENHLHPDLQRSLLDFLFVLSQEKQVIISTHSPIFASRPDVRSVYFVSKNEEENTIVTELNEQNVHKLIDRLGVRPSDIFDYDTIVFVEGQSDVRILNAFKKTLSAKYSGTNVGIIDADGWNSMAYYANAKIAKSMRPYRSVYAIFDGDTEKSERNKEIKQKLLNTMGLDENHIITLGKSCIEAYLVVPNAIRRAFPQIQLNIDEINEMIGKSEGKRNKKETLRKIFEKGTIGLYDVDKGEKVAQFMTEEEIDNELKGIFKEFQATRADHSATPDIDILHKDKTGISSKEARPKPK